MLRCLVYIPTLQMSTTHRIKENRGRTYPENTGSLQVEQNQHYNAQNSKEVHMYDPFSYGIRLPLEHGFYIRSREGWPLTFCNASQHIGLSSLWEIVFASRNSVPCDCISLRLRRTMDPRCTSIHFQPEPRKCFRRGSVPPAFSTDSH